MSPWRMRTAPGTDRLSQTTIRRLSVAAPVVLCLWLVAGCATTTSSEMNTDGLTAYVTNAQDNG